MEVGWTEIPQQMDPVFIIIKIAALLKANEVCYSTGID